MYEENIELRNGSCATLWHQRVGAALLFVRSLQRGRHRLASVYGYTVHYDKTDRWTAAR